MTKTYTTRNEAIEREIVDALGEQAAEFDIEKIAEQTIESRGDATGFYCTVTPEEFWAVVAECEK